MSNFFDTLMNLFVFAFVGVLVWLYFKETVSDRRHRDDNPEREA
jgi:hypothetical protein